MIQNMHYFPVLSLFLIGLFGLFWISGIVWVLRRISTPLGRLLFLLLVVLMAATAESSTGILSALNHSRLAAPYVLTMAVNGVLCALGLFYLIVEGYQRLLDRLHRTVPSGVDLSRRNSVFLMGAGFASLTGTGSFGTAYIGFQELRRTDYHFNGDGLGLFLARPLRLAFFSDLHAGFFLPPTRTRELLAQLRHAQPDAILFGGDAIDSDWHSIEDLETLFRGCVDLAPTVAVLGNRDHANPVDMTSYLEGMGVTVLQNQLYLLPGGVTLAGAEDELFKPGGHSCLLQADGPSILLAHNPMSLFSLSAEAQAATALMLSGHTHGGQVAMPGFGPLVVRDDPRLVSGLVTLEERPPVIITNGVGVTTVPIRIGAPPEWVMIHIQPGRDVQASTRES